MKQNVIIVASVVLLVIVGFLLFSRDEVIAPLSGVAVSSEYQATTTNSAVAGFEDSLCVGPCTLGSIIVASSSGTTFKIMNATSTTDVSSSTAVTLVASISAGTYTFDVMYARGVAVDVPEGFNGQYIVTWR